MVRVKGLIGFFCGWVAKFTTGQQQQQQQQRRVTLERDAPSSKKNGQVFSLDEKPGH